MANEFKEKRKDYQVQGIVKIKMIDFYLKMACEKKYISYKKYQKISFHLLDVLRQIYGWIKYEEKEKTL